ncbi:MAG: hypothetical protein RI988_2690 [Pseudomonadota bacterium]
MSPLRVPPRRRLRTPRQLRRRRVPLGPASSAAAACTISLTLVRPGPRFHLRICHRGRPSRPCLYACVGPYISSPAMLRRGALMHQLPPAAMHGPHGSQRTTCGARRCQPWVRVHRSLLQRWRPLRSAPRRVLARSSQARNRRPRAAGCHLGPRRRSRSVCLTPRMLRLRARVASP